MDNKSIYQLNGLLLILILATLLFTILIVSCFNANIIIIIPILIFTIISSVIVIINCYKQSKMQYVATVAQI